MSPPAPPPALVVDADVVGSAGRAIERQDAWVAATALYLDLPLVTHNARHFTSVPGLRIIAEPDPAP